MRYFRVLVLGLFLITIISSEGFCQATQGPSLADDVSNYPAFYTIEEPPPERPQRAALGQFQPAHDFISLQTIALQTREIAINLLRWAMFKSPLPRATVPYDRILHFGRWINDPTDETCYNTRSKVLIRDSVGPVSFRLQNHCVVDRGHWNEPYTAQRLDDSRAIQIDHMVPLKNAYQSGAWQWNFQTRCTYANFMGNNFHLISSSGQENMRKGDRAPNGYLPPALGYRCQYLENWLKVKLIWHLRMTQEEVVAIDAGIKENHCNPAKFSLTDSQLKAQRKIIFTNTDMCPDKH
jgi:hypothetical protein